MGLALVLVLLEGVVILGYLAVLSVVVGGKL